jgi:hypothetical protein
VNADPKIRFVLHSAGSYVPTERLDAVRRVFFPHPGRTTGGRRQPVATQADEPGFGDYVENVRFEKGGVVFASVHVVGSENGLAPWSGLPGGDRPAERIAEVEARTVAALAWIDEAFDEAEDDDAAGVLLLLQAEPVESPGFSAIRHGVELAQDAGRPPDGRRLLVGAHDRRPLVSSP